jgi:hypothetical protein
MESLEIGVGPHGMQYVAPSPALTNTSNPWLLVSDSADPKVEGHDVFAALFQAEYSHETWLSPTASKSLMVSYS